jgi:hypothetical protein
MALRQRRDASRMWESARGLAVRALDAIVLRCTREQMTDLKYQVAGVSATRLVMHTLERPEGLHKLAELTSGAAAERLAERMREPGALAAPQLEPLLWFASAAQATEHALRGHTATALSDIVAALGPEAL